MAERERINSEQSWSFDRSWRQLFWLLVILGAALRLISLGERPIHHDESLHAVYGKYWYDNAETGFYKYDPMLHGPLLYYFIRVSYLIFDVSDWSARLPVALLGVLFVAAPILFRRYLSPVAVLSLTGVLALSPTLTYWSRFIRHDYFSVAGMLVMLSGCCLVRDRLRAPVVLLGLAIHATASENVYLTLALLVGYLCYEAAALKALRGENDSLLRRLLRHVYEHPATVIIGFGLAALWYCYFFAGGFNNPRSVATVCAVLIILTGCCVVQGWLGAVVVLVGLGLHLAASENAYLTAALLVAYFGYEAVLLIVQGGGKDTFLQRPILYLRKYPLWVFIGLCLAALCYGYFFSGGVRYPEGIFDGLYRRSLTYWFGQHAMERIPGPFLHLFYALTWYELPLIAAIVAQLSLFYSRGTKAWRVTGALLFAVPLVIAAAMPEDVTSIALLKELKLKHPQDVFGFIVLVLQALLATTYHLSRGERTLAFFGYFFFASFFTYSFVGERVPWLAIYPTVTGFLYLTLYFDHFPLRLPAPALAGVVMAIAAYNLWVSALVNFQHPGAAKEYISQVHTTPQFDRMVRDLIAELRLHPDRKAASTGESTWPSFWYLRGVPNWSFHRTDFAEFDLVIKDWSADEQMTGYAVERLEFRGWWVPDWRELTLGKLLLYSFTHEPWSPPGYSYVNLFRRKNELLMTPLKPELR